MLLVGAVGSTWGDEVTIWSEDFSSYSSADQPSGGIFSYVCTKGGSTTQIYNEKTAGGEAPELLISKSGGSFQATISDLKNCSGTMNLSFYTNQTGLKISIKTNNNTSLSTSGSIVSKKKSTMTFTVPDGTTSLTISFSMTTSNNARLDNIELKGTTSSLETVATPTFSPAAGTYTSTQNVTISTETSGATIYYTTDGNDPTTSSNVFNSALTIDETTTIKAIAVMDGMTNSAIAEATYTITQPLTTIDAIFAAATQAGNTATPKVVTFNNWVVTGVKGSNAYVTDGTKGFIIYQSSHGFNVGDVLSGTASCKVQLYKAAAEITDLSSSTTGLTVTTGGTVTPVTTISIADLSGINTGAVISYENLAFDGTNLSDGTNTIKPFNSLYNYSMTNGKSYNVTGIFVQFGETKEILPRSTEDIEEVVITVPFINSSDIEIVYNATSGSISYTIDNGVEGTNLEATTDADWISNIVVGESEISFVCTVNNGNEDRTATLTLTYGDVTKEITVTQKHLIVDYAELPFEWEGGASADFLALNGVTANGLGSDYASNNNPYLIKFDGTGDYIQIKTNERPGTVTISVKMIGGANSSSITVQESSDGETFTDVQELTISGAQNSVVNLETSADFAETSRYVRLYFTKGSNVGVGPITIAKYTAPQEYNLSVALSDNISAIYVFNTEDVSNPLIEDGIAGSVQVTGGTQIMVSPDVEQGYQLESLMVDGVDVKNQIDDSGAYTFTMPAHDVAISATAVENVEPSTATYVLATSITSGKHYIIVNQEASKAMGEQKTNNRAAVEVQIQDQTITVSSADDVHEFLIESATIGEKSGYSISDVTSSGYLYAASSGSNYLKTQSQNDANGVWTISISNEGAASIVAQGSNTRNVMQYNNGSSLFACYSSASQNPVYLYERVEPTPEPDTISVTISAAGYSTLYYGRKNLTVPTGMEAYTVKVTTQVELSTTYEADDVIPAGTGVVLKAARGTYKFAVAAEAGPKDANNMLRGNDVEATTTGGTYYYALTLDKNHQNPGFYWMKENGAAYEAGAHKAYLALDKKFADLAEGTETGVKGFLALPGDGIVTGIEAMANGQWTMDNAEIYNLAGQRVQKMQKGIYVVGGKKVMVK